MSFCSIGFWNAKEKGGAVTVNGQQCVCPHGTKPLLRWVELNDYVWYGGDANNVICEDCYKKIFGGHAMPSTYKGNEFGRLVTAEDDRKRTADSVSAYSYYGGDGQPLLPFPAAAPPAPAAPASGIVKPQLMRQNARYFTSPFRK